MPDDADRVLPHEPNVHLGKPKGSASLTHSGRGICDNVPKSLIVTAWCDSNGFMNLWIPTSAVIMGGLTLAKVGYDKYIKFVLPYLALMFVLISAFLAVGAAIG